MYLGGQRYPFLLRFVRATLAKKGYIAVSPPPPDGFPPLFRNESVPDIYSPLGGGLIDPGMGPPAWIYPAIILDALGCSYLATMLSGLWLTRFVSRFQITNRFD